MTVTPCCPSIPPSAEFIRVEGFNTQEPAFRRGSFRALKKGIKPRIQIPYENNIPRPFRARLLIGEDQEASQQEITPKAHYGGPEFCPHGLGQEEKEGAGNAVVNKTHEGNREDV
jgi:hypothetical protein